MQGEQRGARRAARCNDGRDERVLRSVWCKESVVRKKRGQRWETREKGAAAACRPTGRLPRLVGACGASRSVQIARRAWCTESSVTFTKAGRPGRGAKRAWCKESVVERRARVQRVSTAPSGSSSDRVSAPVWPWWAWWAWWAWGLVRKKRVVQGERGARRAWRADEVETKKRRGGRGARGVWCERSAWCKASVRWCKESVVQGEQRGATTEEMSAC